MKTCVFLGPTIPQEDAKAIFEALYLPPVRRGDVLKAVAIHEPETIAIIDGYFEQVPSVWHKELLWALDQGIAVYGAASMGALRAAELAQFGMIGIGRIFDAYVSGRFDPFDDPFEDDDEVAVVHGPAEVGYAGSDAMVDIRATLVEAERAGVLDRAQCNAIAMSSKSIFYKHRTWKTVLDAVDVPTSVCEALEAWLPANKVSQKRHDAEELLRHLRDGSAPFEMTPFRFERTLLFEAVLEADLAGKGQ